MLIFLRKEKNILLTFESGQYFVLSLGPSVKIFPPLQDLSTIARVYKLSYSAFS
jgi:hypothetical protein